MLFVVGFFVLFSFGGGVFVCYYLVVVFFTFMWSGGGCNLSVVNVMAGTSKLNGDSMWVVAWRKGFHKFRFPP